MRLMLEEARISKEAADKHGVGIYTSKPRSSVSSDFLKRTLGHVVKKNQSIAKAEEQRRASPLPPTATLPRRKPNHSNRLLNETLSSAIKHNSKLDQQQSERKPLSWKPKRRTRQCRDNSAPSSDELH